MELPIDKYTREHSRMTLEREEALAWIEKQTNIRTNYPHMLCNHLQGKLLSMLVQISGALNIMEIGTFTGYSAACLAFGLQDGTDPARRRQCSTNKGKVHTIEINDELEDLTREGWNRAGVADLIDLHIGDALKIIPSLEAPFDLVFIDANKREYTRYLEAVLPALRTGGIIIVDDVLWDGKVYQDTPSCDKQTQSLITFNDLLSTDPRLDSVMLPLRHGLSIAVKRF